MQPDLAVSSHGGAAVGFKAYVGLQLAFYFHQAIFQLDGNIFDRRVFVVEDELVENVGHGLWRNGHFCRGNTQIKGILVVEDGDAVRFGGNQFATQFEDVYRGIVANVVHHVIHLRLDRSIGRFLLGFRRFLSGCRGADKENWEKENWENERGEPYQAAATRTAFRFSRIAHECLCLEPETLIRVA